MARLEWNAIGERIYGTGVDRGVLYPSVGPGIPWHGLISVSESEGGPKETVAFIDGAKYRNQIVLDTFSATVNAFTYPDKMDDKWGRLVKTPFNFSYRTLFGSDVTPDAGYQIHLVFNARFLPSDKTFTSINNSAEATSFSWEVATTPVKIPDLRPSSHLVIDSRVAYPWVIEELEGLLYGSDLNDPTFPSPETILDMFEVGSILRIIDHGDGSWTAIGPDEVIQMLDETSFEITWPSAIFLTEDTYRISSL